MKMKYIIRNAKKEEFEDVGKLLVSTYLALDGFPPREMKPDYFDVLENAGDLTEDADVELLVAVTEDEGLVHGAVIYIKDLKHYGSGHSEELPDHGASAMRFLAVDPVARGQGLGKKLTNECIQKAKDSGHTKMFLHTSHTMPIAWAMYEKMGFKRYEPIDFQWIPTIRACGFYLDI